jgi:hypothetical protein
MIEILYAADWRTHKETEQSYTSTPTDETSPTKGARFARIQAHDGDLCIEVRAKRDKGPVANTGSYRCFQGPTVIQLPRADDVIVISIISASGTVKGSIQWGY